MARVVVAGSINMDVVAVADRHPRIGETVTGRSVGHFPGGKGANQAVAAAKQGAQTQLVGRVGTDGFGAHLRSFLTANGVDVSLVRDTAGHPTGTAIVTVADADNTIVVIPGANGQVAVEDLATVPLRPGDIAISQFEIPLGAVAAFFTRARAMGARTILNPAPMRDMDTSWLHLTDVLVLNETELAELAKTAVHATDDPDDIARIAAGLRTEAGQTICVTLGARGVVAVTASGPLQVPGHAVTTVDTTGAGDCFVGSLAAQLAGGASIEHAIRYANASAAVCVQRMGAAPSMPTGTEVRQFLLRRVRF